MASPKNIIILGGYGRAGHEIAKLLLKVSPHNICLAGRDRIKACRASNELNFRHFGQRVTGIEVNTALHKQFTRVLADYDLVIVAMPVTGIGGSIARAAMDAKIDYIDLNADSEKRQVLRELDGEIREAGLTFITEAGFVPGAPSMMARYVAGHFDSLDEVTIGGLFKEERISYGSMVDVITTLGDSPGIFTDGSWSKAGMTVMKKIDFGKGLGIRSCFPMDLAELHGLPEELGCQQLGFYGSGVNRFFDSMVLLWKALGLYKTSRGIDLGARVLVWGNEKFTRQPYICSVNTVASGFSGGREKQVKLTVEHKDSYAATAIAIIPGIMGLLDGSISQSGVHIMGHVLDPDRYLENLWDMGMTVSLQGLCEMELELEVSPAREMRLAV